VRSRTARVHGPDKRYAPNGKNAENHGENEEQIQGKVKHLSEQLKAVLESPIVIVRLGFAVDVVGAAPGSREKKRNSPGAHNEENEGRQTHDIHQHANQLLHTFGPPINLPISGDFAAVHFALARAKTAEEEGVSPGKHAECQGDCAQYVEKSKEKLRDAIRPPVPRPIIRKWLCCFEAIEKRDAPKEHVGKREKWENKNVHQS